jgi:hypothetical protein
VAPPGVPVLAAAAHAGVVGARDGGAPGAGEPGDDGRDGAPVVTP